MIIQSFSCEPLICILQRNSEDLTSKEVLTRESVPAFGRSTNTPLENGKSVDAMENSLLCIDMFLFNDKKKKGMDMFLICPRNSMCDRSNDNLCQHLDCLSWLSFVGHQGSRDALAIRLGISCTGNFYSSCNIEAYN